MNAGTMSRDRDLISLTGSVRRSDNQPITNARIELRDMAGAIVASTYSGPSGSFEISNLPAGRYELTANEGLNETRQTILVDRGQSTVTLRLGESQAAGAGNTSVSVAEMRVPDKARKALNKARELFEKKRVDDARKEIAHALEVYPHYAAAFCQRGIIALTEGKFSDARTDFEQAIKDDPNGAMSYIGFAAASNAQAKFDDAIRAVERGVSLAPAAWQGYFEMARAYLGKSDFAAALRSADRAQQFAKVEYPPLHLVRAHALLGVKNYSEAVAELETYLRVETSESDIAKARQQLDEVKSFAAGGGK